MTNSREKSMEVYKRIAIFSWAILGLVALMLFVFFLIRTFRPIFSLFVYVFFIVYILKPLVDFFEEKRIPRFFATLFAYLIVALVIALILLYIVPVLVEEVRGFIKDFPFYFKEAIKLFKEYQGRFKKFHVPPEATRLIEGWLSNLRKSAAHLVSRIPLATVNVFTWLFYLVLAPVIAFYILLDLKKIKKTIIMLIPERRREETLEILRDVERVVGGFIRGQFLVALSVAVLASIALTILGVNYAVFLGIITGALNVIPYFGPIIGGALAFLVALLKSPVTALWVVIVMFIIQQVDGLFISPHIVGKQVSLHPVLVMLALFIGGSLLGVTGMLIAIPIAASGKALVLHFQHRIEEGEDKK